jgi:hypothetical protein
MHNKMLDLVVQNPTGPLFDLWAQKIVAIGLLAFLLMWGVAKIIKSWPK